ncbi:MAG: hypothetical protein Q8R83_11115 [Legionellaceae bacterium]|nr:hypothetical protein [Legionellaceae bacterium]
MQDQKTENNQKITNPLISLKKFCEENKDFWWFKLLFPTRLQADLANIETKPATAFKTYFDNRLWLGVLNFFFFFSAAKPDIIKEIDNDDLTLACNTVYIWDNASLLIDKQFYKIEQFVEVNRRRTGTNTEKNSEFYLRNLLKQPTNNNPEKPSLAVNPNEGPILQDTADIDTIALTEDNTEKLSEFSADTLPSVEPISQYTNDIDRLYTFLKENREQLNKISIYDIGRTLHEIQSAENILFKQLVTIYDNAKHTKSFARLIGEIIHQKNKNLAEIVLYLVRTKKIAVSNPLMVDALLRFAKEEKASEMIKWVEIAKKANQNTPSVDERLLTVIKSHLNSVIKESHTPVNAAILEDSKAPKEGLSPSIANHSVSGDISVDEASHIPIETDTALDNNNKTEVDDSYLSSLSRGVVSVVSNSGDVLNSVARRSSVIFQQVSGFSSSESEGDSAKNNSSSSGSRNIDKNEMMAVFSKTIFAQEIIRDERVQEDIEKRKEEVINQIMSMDPAVISALHEFMLISPHLVTKKTFNQLKYLTKNSILLSSIFNVISKLSLNQRNNNNLQTFSNIIQSRDLQGITSLFEKLFPKDTIVGAFVAVIPGMSSDTLSLNNKKKLFKIIVNQNPFEREINFYKKLVSASHFDNLTKDKIKFIHGFYNVYRNRSIANSFESNFVIIFELFSNLKTKAFLEKEIENILRHKNIDGLNQNIQKLVSAGFDLNNLSKVQVNYLFAMNPGEFAHFVEAISSADNVSEKDSDLLGDSSPTKRVNLIRQIMTQINLPEDYSIEDAIKNSGLLTKDESELNNLLASVSFEKNDPNDIQRVKQDRLNAIQLFFSNEISTDYFIKNSLEILEYSDGTKIKERYDLLQNNLTKSSKNYSEIFDQNVEFFDKIPSYLEKKNISRDKLSLVLGKDVNTKFQGKKIFDAVLLLYTKDLLDKDLSNLKKLLPHLDHVAMLSQVVSRNGTIPNLLQSLLRHTDIKLIIYTIEQLEQLNLNKKQTTPDIDRAIVALINLPPDQQKAIYKHLIDVTHSKGSLSSKDDIDKLMSLISGNKQPNKSEPSMFDAVTSLFWTTPVSPHSDKQSSVGSTLTPGQKRGGSDE